MAINTNNYYGLVIGISSYKNLIEVHSVGLKDAQDIYAVLTDVQYGGYPEQNVQLLLEQKANKHNILESLNKLSFQCNADSTVFIYISCDGTRISSGPYSDGYLLPFDATFKDPKILAETSISGEELKKALSKIPARKVVIVLDSAHSGGFGLPKGIVPREFKTGLSDGFYNELKEESNRVIIASSRNDEYSWILPNTKHTLFTQSLLEGLRGGVPGPGGVIRVFDLYNYVQAKVTQKRPEQHPIFKADLEENFALALFRGGNWLDMSFVGDTPMDDYKYDVFISYRQQEPDKEWVQEALIPGLEAAGLRVLADYRDFRLGAPIVTEMARAVEESRYTLAVLSPSFMQSGFTALENIIAQQMGLEKGQRRLIAIMRQSFRPSLRIRARQWLDMTADSEFELNLSRLIYEIKEPVGRRQPEDYSKRDELLGTVSNLHREDLLNAPGVSTFYDRASELRTLKEMVLTDNEKFITVWGFGGVGKSSLVAQFININKNEFDYIFWRDAKNGMSSEAFILELATFLDDAKAIDVPKTNRGAIQRLEKYLKEYQCLIVIDSFEAILSAGSGELENYRDFLNLIATRSHRSCLIIISREATGLAHEHILQLGGLDLEGSHRLLVESGLSGSQEELTNLHDYYSGNPLALKLAAQSIRQTFRGDISSFLLETPYYGQLDDLLANQLSGLSNIEKEVLYWLSALRQEISFEEAEARFNQRKLFGNDFRAAVLSLAGKSLVNINREVLSIPAVIIEYVLSEFSKETDVQQKQIQIAFEQGNGCFVNRESKLTLRINSLASKAIKNILIEIDETTKYQLTGERQWVLTQLEKDQSEDISVSIIATEIGKTPLHLKINGNVYKEQLLDIYVAADNPYFYGPPVKDSSAFFGREAELQKCLNNVLRPGGAHSMIIGEQRSGKTSLLYQIQNSLQSPFFTVYISLSGIERQTDSALTWLLENIKDNLVEKKLITQEHTINPIKYSTDFIKEFVSIIDTAKREHSTFRLTILLDEAHIMSELGIKFQEVLREAFNKTIRDVRVILACYYDFVVSTGNSSSPLQNIFEYIFLKPLEGQDLENLITAPAHRFGYQYEKAALDLIKSVSGGHPYYSQFLCAKSFDNAAQSKKMLIQVDHVNIAEQLVIESEKHRFMMGYWGRFNNNEKIWLKQFVENGFARNDPQVIRGLINKYVISKKNKGEYVFSCTLFEKWIISIIHEES